MVGQVPRGEGRAKGRDLAVRRVAQHDMAPDPGGQRLIEEIERVLPLGRKGDRVRHACGATPRAVDGPRLREIQPQPDAPAPALARQVQTRRHLAVVGAAQRARVLARDAHGVRALFGKAGVVDHEGGDRRQFAVQQAAHPGEHLAGVPRTHHDALLQPLPHRLDLARLIDQPRGDRLDTFPLPIQQQAGHVLPHRRAALGTAQAGGQRVEIGGQLAIEALQRVGRHPLRRSRFDRRVKK
jgi:hypothetical protein